MFALKRNVVRAFIYRPDKKAVLLVKSYIANFYSLPGGGINKGESEKDALIRELQEELDLDITLIKDLTFVNNVYSKKHLFFLPLESSITFFSLTYPNEIKSRFNWEIRKHIWAEPKELSSLLRTYNQAPF